MRWCPMAWDSFRSDRQLGKGWVGLRWVADVAIGRCVEASVVGKASENRSDGLNGNGARMYWGS